MLVQRNYQKYGHLHHLKLPSVDMTTIYQRKHEASLLWCQKCVYMSKKFFLWLYVTIIVDETLNISLGEKSNVSATGSQRSINFPG